jgi:hypothetical protein
MRTSNSGHILRDFLLFIDSWYECMMDAFLGGGSMQTQKISVCTMNDNPSGTFLGIIKQGSLHFLMPAYSVKGSGFDLQ